MKNQILSVGIDIGTTTTQVIFSELTVQNTAANFLIPEVKITEKNIVYKSKIYLTPLIDREKVNLQELKEIVLREYEIAGISKKEISTGAIIITGETARKENAEEVLNILSDFSGDFVVATAGPDLEAVLAGCGAGASEASKKLTCKVINFDIGGGTTNAAVFWDGEVIDSFALDIGGKLIRFNEEGKIIYISHKLQELIKSLNLNLKIGITPNFKDLQLLTEELAKVLLSIANRESINEQSEKLFINHKDKALETEFIMFSGGVAEFIYCDSEINNLDEVAEFGDIGPLLGYSIKKVFKKYKHKLLEPKEKIRATVIGAGSHSIKVSGSTVVFDDDMLPIKNVPIIKLFNNWKDENISYIYKSICEKIKLYKDIPTAIAFKGPKCASYLQIKSMAMGIVEALKNSNEIIIVIVENDFAKALGQSIQNALSNSKKVICIDNIKVQNGDYIDIGKSIAGVVPVVVKTLIF